jgi:hypothetical protein
MKPQAVKNQPVITFHRSQLTVTFSSIAADKITYINLEIYSLSGKLLYTFKNAAIINGIIRCTIPASVSTSHQALIIRAKTGNSSFTKTVALR